jgi:hypothetical protein
MNTERIHHRHTWGQGIGRTIVAAIMAIGLTLGSFVQMARAEAPDVKLDCSIYETKETNFGMAFKVAHFFFNTGPEFSFSRKSGVAWDKVVHGTIARYVELCSRYNAGLVNKAEYEARMKEIESLYKESKEMEAKLYAATRQRAKDAGDELDAELGRKPRASAGKQNVESSVEQLADRVEHLEPISQPLKPSTPCPPPDMLGAPGRTC